MLPLSLADANVEHTIRKIGGNPEHYHIGYYPNQSYAFYDTWDALKTGLNIKVDRDNSEMMDKVRAMIAEE